MSNVLSMRLKRLERQTDAGNPFADLSDEELEARLQELTLKIEANLGMSMADYADLLTKMLENGVPLPDGLTRQDAQTLIKLSAQ